MKDKDAATLIGDILAIPSGNMLTLSAADLAKIKSIATGHESADDNAIVDWLIRQIGYPCKAWQSVCGGYTFEHVHLGKGSVTGGV